MFLRIDASSIRQVNSQELDPETQSSETGIVISKDWSIIEAPPESDHSAPSSPERIQTAQK
jgi:hypothetical protein